jgi:DNA modification methylase
MRLWSNPGDVVLEPFGGIGSGGHVALGEGRRYLAAELKPSYYAQLVANLRAAEQRTLELLPRAKYLNVCGPTLGERAESATSDLPEAV